jgi:nitrate reductase alpha subunit
MKIKNTLIIAVATGLLLSAPALESNAQITVANNESGQTIPSKLTILEVKPMQFRVSYNTPESPAILVRILDSNNSVLFSEKKRTNTNYLKYFDLSTLLDGTYTFEITDGKEKTSQSFDILTKTSRVVSSIN